MEKLKWSSGKLFFGDCCLSESAICDFRKALLEAVSDGVGEWEDFHIEDEGKAGYLCGMVPPEEGPMLETRLNNDGVMSFLLAARKLQLTSDFGLDTEHVDDWSEKNALEAIQSEVIFSI